MWKSSFPWNVLLKRYLDTAIHFYFVFKFPRLRGISSRCRTCYRINNKGLREADLHLNYTLGTKAMVPVAELGLGCAKSQQNPPCSGVEYFNLDLTINILAKNVTDSRPQALSPYSCTELERSPLKNSYPYFLMTLAKAVSELDFVWFRENKN